MMYCTDFSYKTSIKNLDSEEDYHEEQSFQNIQLAFIQIEKHDEENEKSSEKKLVNFLKWVARKNDCKTILLHSFAHLSESKADASFSKNMLQRVQERLEKVDYKAFQTPFGYFLDLNISAPGFSMARVFKSF